MGSFRFEQRFSLTPMANKQYKFFLRFDDENNSLSTKRGLTLKELHLLLKAIDDVTNPGDNSFISISDIEEGSYQIDIITDSLPRYEKIVKVHSNLEYKSFDDLPADELKYAKTLIGNLLINNRFVESYDDKKKLISKVTSKDIGKDIESYFIVTTVSGVISEIGAKTLEGKTHIEIDGVGYKVFTEPDQDKELKKYYRDGKVNFKVKQKIRIKNKKVASATLVDFKPATKGSLMENLSALQKDALLIVKDIHSHEEVLRLIRDTQ